MGKTLKYVKEFDFGPQKTYVSGYARGGCAKKKMAEGGMAKHEDIAEDKALIRTAVHKHESAMHPGKPQTKLKKGGVFEKATGERYPTRAAMVKHESMETPMEQKREVVQKSLTKNMPVRRVPVAPVSPLLAMRQGLKQGGVPKAGAFKVPKVMHEFKAGELHSGSPTGPVVKSRKQAVAIALSEARKAGKK